MAHPDALVHIAEQLSSARSYTDIFGTLPGADLSARRGALRQQFGFLARMVHPDHNPPESAKYAGDTFDSLNKLRQGADEALLNGSYEKQFSKRSNGSGAGSAGAFELKSANGVYRLQEKWFAKGDFSVLYRGQAISPNVVPVIAKVATVPTNNSWLERDASVLDRFRQAKSTDPLAGIRRFVPALLDAFLIEGKNHTRFRVTVIKDVPDLVSVTEIMAAYPKGLDPREASWIYRRIIAQTLAASMAGVVHSAMVPDHVLVDPYKHEPLHIGWAHAIDDPAISGRRITHLIDRWRDFYPPEVFEKKLPDHRTDLFMAAKTMIALLGGDVKTNRLPLVVPKTVGEVILRSVEPSPARRPQDGKQLLDDFTRVIRKEWGRAYRPLTMPVR